MWTEREKPKILLATKKLATEWAEMPSIPHDRPLNERRKEVYAQAYSDGQLRSLAWAKCLCDEDDTTYRVNGRHTSTMLATYPGELINQLFVMVESYRCDRLEDLPRLYATFDSKIQSRTVNDINRTFAASNPEISHIPGNTINVLVSGLSYALWQDNAYARQPFERASLLMENVEFAEWFYGMIHTVKPVILHRAPVVGAMYNTWMKSKKDADRFWNAVQDATSPTPDYPDRKLNYWLTVNTMTLRKTTRVPSSMNHKASPREVYARCIHAWNASRRGDNPVIRYVIADPLPKVL
jgi:hypothetical protein